MITFKRLKKPITRLNFVRAEQHNPFSVGDLVKTNKISLIPVEKDLWMVSAVPKATRTLEVAKVPEGRFQPLDTAFPPHDWTGYLWNSQQEPDKVLLIQFLTLNNLNRKNWAPGDGWSSERKAFVSCWEKCWVQQQLRSLHIVWHIKCHFWKGDTLEGLTFKTFDS